jgi:beta-lactamase regulating signal transducer with metallopeptidase domain
MPILFSIDLAGEEIIRAVNWTLIHSLWQGMILSVVAGSIVFFTKKSKPALRYNLLTGALFVFIMAVGVTFSMQITKANEFANTVQEIPSYQTISSSSSVQSTVVESKLSAIDKAITFFNTNANWIVLTWLSIMALQFIRLTAGFYGVYKLERMQIFSAGEYWNNRIIELSRQLQIKKQVKLLQSGMAKMPAVIGYFKPVILFPAGMLASLPPQEVEAILMHELAHVQRKDFLVNVMQQVIEIVFFFNPAVLWVSALIKSERENCCDDIAVSQTNSKENYIKALLSFEQFNQPLAYPLADAFSGQKNHLINRIKRIIYNNNKTLNNMEKKFLAAGLIITSVCIFAFSSNKAQQNGLSKKAVSEKSNPPLNGKSIATSPKFTDTVPAPQYSDLNGKISTTVNGKKYTLVTEDNEVSELYINGKKIPAEKMKDYKSVTSKILLQTKLDKAQSEKELAEAASEIEQSKKELEESKAEIEQSNIEMQRAKKEMDEDKEIAKKEMEKAQVEMQQSKLEMARAKVEMEQAQKEMKLDMVQAKNDIEQSQKQVMKAQKEMEQSKMKQEMQQAKVEMEQAKKEMEQSKIQMQQSKREMKQSQLLQEKIIDDLINEHIIKGRMELSSLKLNNQELSVNGVKQPDAIYKRFKEKYVKDKNFSMMFNNSEEVK